MIRKTILYLILLLMVSINVYATVITDSYSCWDFATNTTTQQDPYGSNDMSISGATWNTGGYYYFDGINNYGQFNLLELSVTDDFSFSLWIKSGGYVGSMIDNTEDRGDTYLAMDMLADRTTRLIAEGTGSTTAVTASSSSVAANDRWVLVTYVYNGTGSNVKMYHNNTLVANKAESLSGRLSSTSYWFVAARHYQDGGGGTDSFWVGNMHGILFYNKTLTPANVADIVGLGPSFACSADTTAPNLTLIYPTNNTHYSDYNGSILVNASETIVSCSVNNTNWVDQGIKNNILADFYRSTIPDANYSITVSCNDSYSNTGTTSFWFITDTVDPQSTLNSPENNSIQSGNVNIDVAYYDLWLWKTNTTIYNSTGTAVYNNYSGELNTEWYNLTDTWDSSSYTDGTYTLRREAADTHTSKVFNERLIEVKGKDDYKDVTVYQLSKGDIQFYYPNDIELITKKETDRFTQELRIKKDSVRTTRAYIEIMAKNVVYLENSTYPCHMIINDKYWYDCVGLDNPRMKQISSNRYMITYDIKQDKSSSFTRSLGGLNEIDINTTFIVDNTAPYYTSITNTTTSSVLSLMLNTSENVTMDWNFGQNCTATDDSGSESLSDNFMLTELSLSSSTTYYWNITINDTAGNTVNNCFNLTTSSATGGVTLNNILFKAQINNGTGYADIPGSLVSTYETTGSATFIYNFNANDTLNIVGKRDTTTSASTTANACRLNIEKIG